MNKYKIKLKNIVNERKNIFVFLTIIVILGIIFGSLFITILNTEDKLEVKNQVNNFFNTITTNSINKTEIIKSSLISNLFSVLFIWLLGASGIGIIIIVLFLFIKGFILGFSVASICYTYGLKGIIIALAYIFPHDLIMILTIFILSLKSFNLSLSFLKNLFTKKTIDYKLFGKKYLRLLILIILISILSSLLETYVSPILINLLKPLF